MGVLTRIADLSDQLVDVIDPRLGLNRRRARAAIGAFSDSGYMTPQSPKKSMRGITAKRNSPAIDIDRKHEDMVALSRDFSMNMPLAVATFRRFRTNVPGAGLQVQPRIDQAFLGLTDDQAQEFVDAAIREFDLWSNSVESDYEGMATPNELQSLLYMTSIVNGDVFYTLPMVDQRAKGWPYKTVVRVIDGDLVRTPSDEMMPIVPANGKIRNGMEFDGKGRFSAVHVANFYKNDYYGSETNKFTRVPVYDDNGERQIFHMLDFERIGQRRGLPMLAPIVNGLKQHSRLTENELMSQLLASMFTVFVRDSDGYGGALTSGHRPDEMIHGGGREDFDDAEEDKDEGYELDLEMGAGNIHYLEGQRDISIAETRKKGEFAPFSKAIATELTAATEIPYEVVVLEFQKSYSAMRGAINEAWKKWGTERQRHSRRICQPWYEAIITEAVIRGRIKAPRFFDDPVYKSAWCGAAWVGTGQGHIDPHKEAKAAALKIRHGLSTHEQEYAVATGGRWSPAIERLAKENAKMEQLGFNFAADDEVNQEEIINDEDVA